MEFKTYWGNIPGKRKDEFARACRCSKGHLRNIAGGFRKASPKLAYFIERASNGVVRKETLCPDFQW